MFSVVPTTRNSSRTHRSRRTTPEKWTVTWFWSCAVAGLTVAVVRSRRILNSLMSLRSIRCLKWTTPKMKNPPCLTPVPRPVNYGHYLTELKRSFFLFQELVNTNTVEIHFYLAWWTHPVLDQSRCRLGVPQATMGSCVTGPLDQYLERDMTFWLAMSQTQIQKVPPS